MLENFLNFYQNLPLTLDPVVFRVGFFSLSWYSLLYVSAFGVVYGLLSWRLKRDKEASFKVSGLRENLDLLFIYLILGVILGARLGYVFFYEPLFFLANPLAIISPFNSGGELVGIYGLSYHGGLLGALLAAFLFSKKTKMDLGNLADFVAPAVPAGYFFGRIGNFFNGELFGRLTDKFWGMYFLDENHLIMLRHPSQLYEAFFEGIVLFLILWPLRNGLKHKKKPFYVPCFALYVLGYGLFRFFIEFFRQPDAQIGFIWNFLTLGQFFSLVMVGIGSYVFWRKIKREKLSSRK
jgi:phosphatidylglycerol:prolipoprotein diacylglycerol transferase